MVNDCWVNGCWGNDYWEDPMARPLTALAGLTRNAVRSAAYYGLGEIARRVASREAPDRPRYIPQRPSPTRAELLRAVWDLLRADAELVRDGICPAFTPDDGPASLWLERARAMLDDIPSATRRAAANEAREVREAAGDAALPDYYLQNFHFQSGGYLTQESAKLYDVQVETLFMGTASLMRRQLMRPLADFIDGRDQRAVRMADIACGSGRFIGQVLEAYPRLNVTGVDLSAAYIDEAKRHLTSLGRLSRRVSLTAANVEALPLADASQDIVSTIFLFHELPAPVRRRAATEIARVLKPGGVLLFLDSAQYGDIPGWDGALESFPHRFHEPYYANYIEDDLDGLFAQAGLVAQETRTVLLSKLMVRRRVDQGCARNPPFTFGSGGLR